MGSCSLSLYILLLPPTLVGVVTKSKVRIFWWHENNNALVKAIRPRFIQWYRIQHDQAKIHSVVQDTAWSSQDSFSGTGYSMIKPRFIQWYRIQHDQAKIHSVVQDTAWSRLHCMRSNHDQSKGKLTWSYCGQMLHFPYTLHRLFLS